MGCLSVARGSVDSGRSSFEDPKENEKKKNYTELYEQSYVKNKRQQTPHFFLLKKKECMPVLRNGPVSRPPQLRPCRAYPCIGYTA